MKGPFSKICFVGVMLTLIFFWGALEAGTTGKISGRVIDKESGQPIWGANVSILGLPYGAATDKDGYFFILNIRPGTYTLKVTCMGYSGQEAYPCEVITDRTTAIDFDLNTTVIETGEVVRVVAERAIVPLDVSNTQQIIDPVKIEATAYHDLTNVIGSQVGVSSFGAKNDRPEIRGSDWRESGFVMDGMLLVDEMNNNPYTRVNLGSVQEIQIITGGFNAEHGNVRSGIVNIVTKEGADKYSGAIDFLYSPPGLKHFGPHIYGLESPIVKPMVFEEYGAFSGTAADGTKNNFFNGWNKYATETLKPGDPHYGQPYECLAVYLWQHRSKSNLEYLQKLVDEGKVDVDMSKIDLDEDAVFEYGDIPDWQGEVNFGGPIPFLNKVKFWASYREDFTEYASVAVEHFHDRNVTMKFTSQITDNIKLNVNFMYGYQIGGSSSQAPTLTSSITSNPFTQNQGGVLGDIQAQSTICCANKEWYPHCMVPGEEWKYVAGLQLTHVLSPATFYEVTFSHMLNEYGMVMDYRNTAPLQGNPWGVNQLMYGRIGTEEQADAKAASGTYGWENWEDWAKVSIGGIWYDEAPWGYGPVNWRDATGEYRMESCNLRENSSYTRTYMLKFALTSQINRFNQVKAGMELFHDRVYFFYKAIDPSVNGGSWDRSGRQNPWRGALYFQDKLEYLGMIANLGLRFDWQWRDKFVSLNYDTPTDKYEGPYPYYFEANKSDSMSYLPHEGKFLYRVSPRMGISHPISENAKIFFNYGHFYQWPDYYSVYRYQQSTVNGYRIERLGNINLIPPRTIQYEVGYAQNLFDMVELKATGYYKDVNSEAGESRFYYINGFVYYTQIPMTYRDIRGVELLADMRYGRYVSGWASLNYMVSSWGNYGYDYFYEDPNREMRQVSSGVSQPYARPYIKANVDFHTPVNFGPSVNGLYPLGGFNLNILFTWRDGEKFTWNPQGIPYVEDNIKWRTYQNWDLRLKKRLFKIKGIEPVFYVDIRNVFNNKNMTYPSGYTYNNDVNRVLTGVSANYAWEQHKWWKQEFQKYMNSLDLTVGDDGKISGPDRPGDYPENWPNQKTEGGKRDYIEMPGFTPWTFLNPRDIYFGIKINFY